MAKHYALGNNSGSIRTQVAAALEDYYGAGVTVHYSSGEYVVFSCAAISDKVIRLQLTSWTYAAYGSAYVSTYNISNAVEFAALYGAATQADLVLADSYILLLIYSNSYVYGLVVIGKMTNGDYLVAASTQSGSARGSNYTYNTTKARESKMVTWNTGFKDGSGKMFRQPLMIAAINGSLEMNEGNPATVSGISNLSGPKNNAAVTVGPDYLITPTWFFSRPEAYFGLAGDLYTPLHVEFGSSVNWRG